MLQALQQVEQSQLAAREWLVRSAERRVHHQRHALLLAQLPTAAVRSSAHRRSILVEQIVKRRFARFARCRSRLGTKRRAAILFAQLRPELCALSILPSEVYDSLIVLD